MNVFFTCKNTLVILLQLYRLYVVQSESRKGKSSKRLESKHKRSKSNQRQQKSKKGSKRREVEDIYTISNERGRG